jgi:formamidopyrimidine-DNA glycosylase
MPELPEVETTRLRLESELAGKIFDRVVVRTAKLRLPVPPDLDVVLPGNTLLSVGRRGKYLLFRCDSGCLIVHLGMTGFLLHLSGATPPGNHDRLDFLFTDGHILRFRDQRKFGLVIWTADNPLTHRLLAGIGPEPLTDGFDGNYLYIVSRSRTIAVKQLIMNSGIVAGVGNIYANEALFRAGIRPDRSSELLDRKDCDKLASTIHDVLSESIVKGSTYRVAEETTSYHPLDFKVYGQRGVACPVCGRMLEMARIGNRSTVFCAYCQK